MRKVLLENDGNKVLAAVGMGMVEGQNARQSDTAFRERAIVA